MSPKLLTFAALALLVACGVSPDVPLSPTAPATSVAGTVPNLPADLTFTVDTVVDKDHAIITAHWTDTNNGTALVDFATPKDWAVGGLWIFKSSWYGTQTSESVDMPAQVWQLYVRTRSPYQPAFVMVTPENIIGTVYYSAWSGPYTVDATGGVVTVANGKRRKK